MRIPDLEAMVAAVEREVAYYTPRAGQLALTKLMVSNYQGLGSMPRYEFDRLVGLALNADGNDVTPGERKERTANTVRTILSHYIVTEEDGRLANDRDKKDHIRVEGVLAALQTEIDSPGDWTDRSE